MVPAWVMITRWAYLELTTAVSAIKLTLMWLDVFTWEENLANFRKFSQDMEYTRAKWTRYGGHMVEAKGEHNS